MSRVAPNLLYLTIYNPTLHPSGPVAPDDEDAEEQAHILFYTSKERAVSRDRMLRQIGLAKALISFSDMFNPDDPCETVHSQTKRMIMVSPEPNFWIHAGIDIARTPRPSTDKTNGKGKDKAGSEGPPLYDYHEHTVHDVAIQADIMRGYEKFKLRHGSFASILSSLGQEALELQLERFFTVWAWSWNLEDGPEFGEHLGPPLHPMQASLVKSIDEFSSTLPDEVVAIAVSSPYIIPSTRYIGMSYPPALSNFLLSLLPPPQRITSCPSAADDSTIKAAKAPLPPHNPEVRRLREPTRRDEESKSFLGMNIDVKMDMPKWNWPGYLTFGKGGKKPHDLLTVTPLNENTGQPSLVLDTPGSERTADFEIDRSALEDAMVSERIPLPVEKLDGKPVDGHSISETFVSREGDEAIGGSSATDASVQPAEIADVDDGSKRSERAPPMPEPEPVKFSSTTVHLETSEDPQITRRRRLFYIVRDSVLVALIWLDDSENPQDFSSGRVAPFAELATSLAATISATMKNDSKSTDSLPTANNILQPKDRYALSSSRLTIQSADFVSRSGHLYDARQLLHQSDPDILDVFSRGQSPQHWHIARRGLGTEDGEAEEVYMEVFRKESSLTDVDNALAGVIRKSAALES
ncbi:hypothetical protein GGX14DRAFT_626007 [Mycena pura]|uniref:CCZ1/INTU/HSP4 first Longin domain-containing protein n=1 Tax=Mycena pura TaxID=153505 RepID=A0AAD6VEG0_9AGAR|nr:hypothetical protein GGX14DRAFT_626007 [Mycena pura]